jgi:exopolyphosphatase/guanosine-5'-triphosphate,3'-diphosphate pyrophosphatase
MGPVLAAIDCGTNSTRVLVSDGGERTLDRRNTITRLGKGVNATGRLDPVAIDRTVEVLRGYRSVMDEHGVSRIRATATSAARDAANSDDFFDAAEAVLGIRPELISGDEEASLSFAGAVGELDPADGPFLVLDIGGGSTEFAFGTEHVESSISVDMGCVRVTEQFLHGDPPLAEELSAALSVIELHLDDVVRTVPQVAGARRLVGLAGTITTIAAIELGLADYDRDAIHHFHLTKAMAEDVFRTLATESLADRLHNPGLEAERADVIVGGACVLVQVMRQLNIDEMLVSEADILDGLVRSMLDVGAA